MKRKLLIAALCGLTTLYGQAQFSKGTRLIGATIGTASFTNGITDYTNAGYSTHSNNWNISATPSYGVFFSDRSAVGASLFLSSAHQKSWNEANNRTYKEDNSHNTDYGLGLFYRHYFNGRSGLYPFAHVYVNGGSGTSKTDGYSYFSPTIYQTYKGKSSDRFFYNAGLNAGVTKMLSATVGLDAFVGYVHSYSQVQTTTNSTAIDQSNNSITYAMSNPKLKYSGNGVSIGVGIQVFLAPRKAK